MRCIGIEKLWYLKSDVAKTSAPARMVLTKTHPIRRTATCRQVVKQLGVLHGSASEGCFQPVENAASSIASGNSPTMPEPTLLNVFSRSQTLCATSS